MFCRIVDRSRLLTARAVTAVNNEQDKCSHSIEATTIVSCPERGRAEYYLVSPFCLGCMHVGFLATARCAFIDTWVLDAVANQHRLEGGGEGENRPVDQRHHTLRGDGVAATLDDLRRGDGDKVG